jgi:hypothetical protein
MVAGMVLKAEGAWQNKLVPFLLACHLQVLYPCHNLLKLYNVCLLSSPSLLIVVGPVCSPERQFKSSPGMRFVQFQGKSSRCCIRIGHFYGKSGCKEMSGYIEDATTLY